MRVKDVMAKHPITIEPETPLRKATAVMMERGVRHLPVVDGGGQLIGMITDRDVRSALFAPMIHEYLSASGRRRLRAVDEALEGLRVKDVMTWGVVTIDAEAPIAHAAAVMFEGRFGSLAVVTKGTLVGIVTERDALKALAATLPSVRGIDPDTYLP
jgi:acetoin utilization protein AcuB